MAITSHHLLKLALELAARPDEASQRAAISRAYYAAYHRCVDWEKQLPKLGSDAGRGGVHACLVSRLAKPHDACDPLQKAKSKSISKLLNLQRKQRGIADYMLRAPVSGELVRRQLEVAKSVLRQCDRSGSNRPLSLRAQS